MNILTQNAKMKLSSKNGIDVYNFGIPAFKSVTGLITCPNAKQCATGCYARSGTYRFSNVVNAYEKRLELTQNKNFIEIMVAEIKAKSIQSTSKDRRCIIRIHDSGDFYNERYLNDWIDIIKGSPNTTFYAYTKMVHLFKNYTYGGFKTIPKNLVVIYSYGGKDDALIDTNTDRHSRVFENESDLLKLGYIDATHDDMIAALSPSNKIGLVYHGNKNYSNTSWSKVS